MKFGLDEIGKPSPPWMERLWTALTMFIFPACAAYILALPADIMSEHTKNILGASSTLILAILKGLKFLFSDEEPGAGTQEQADTNPGKP